MIFLTLGTQKFQFNRLLKAVDGLVGDGYIKEKVFAQVGNSDYKPQNYKYKDYLDETEFSDYIKKSDMVITHAGTGSILTAVKFNKKIIAVPRRAIFNEHVDDHQLQILKRFERMNLIVACKDTGDLKKALDKAYNIGLSSYKTNTENFIKGIDNYLKQVENELHK